MDNLSSYPITNNQSNGSISFDSNKVIQENVRLDQILKTSKILFISGAAGIFAWIPVHPFDFLKTRLQLNSEMSQLKAHNGISGFVKNIYRSEGLKGFYGGLSAGITRQATYTTLRTGLYQIFRDNFIARKEKKRAQLQDISGQVPSFVPPSSLILKAFCGLSAGGIASIICCPIEVSLVRMQADGRLPVSQRRGYKNIFHAIYTISRFEGIKSLWIGWAPTVCRAMVVNLVQLASYDQSKEIIQSYYKLPVALNYVCASLISGFLYCGASFPFDVAKTRIQNQKFKNENDKIYKSIPQTLNLIIKKDGLKGLFKGFLPYYVRGGLHSLFMFVLLEEFNQLFLKK